MNYTNELNLPEPLVDAVKSNHAYKEHRYSVTEVLGGTCEAILKRRHDSEITEDVSQRIWALFGTAVHEILRKAEGTETQLQENWMSVPVGTSYELSGIFDLYDDSTGTVTDYKTCSVWKTQVGDFDDWRKQTLFYCWMLRQIGFNARNGEVVAIMRDHSIRKARTEPGYPRHPVIRLSWSFSDSDLREAEQEIYRWFEEVAIQEKLADDELEPCGPEQRWHKPDRWAVMRKGQKRAVKLFDSRDDALRHMDWLSNQASNKGKALYVEHRPGEDTCCQSYCGIARFCPYGRKFFQDSEDSQPPSADSVL